MTDEPTEATAPRQRPLKNVRTAPAFTIATQQIEELRREYPVERIVDLGSLNPDYLPFLARTMGVPVVGAVRPGASPSDDPVLRHIAFVEATPLEMVRRFRTPGTLFLAMSMLGDLPPQEVQTLFDLIGSAITFSARGVLAGEGRQRDKGGWDHNYVDLLKGWELLELQAQPRPKLPGVETIVGTAYRR